MKGGSGGLGAVGGSSAQMVKQENRDFIIRPSTESIAGGALPSSTMSRVCDPIEDDAKGSIEPVIVHPCISKGLGINAETESSFQTQRVAQDNAHKQNVLHRVERTQRMNVTEQQNDNYDDLVVVKDDEVTTASPSHRFIEAMTEGLSEATMEMDAVTVLATIAQTIRGKGGQGVVAESEIQMEVSKEDIKTIKGQTIQKKFGKKYYLGNVVDYDPETKWFKVVYEDGDAEDLEIWEIKPLLASAAVQPSSSVKRKWSKGAGDEEANTSQKKPRKTPSKSTSKKKKGSDKAILSKAAKSKGEVSKEVSKAKRGMSSGKSVIRSPKSPQLKRKGNVKSKGGRAISKCHEGARKSGLSTGKVIKAKNETGFGKSAINSPKTPHSQREGNVESKSGRWRFKSCKIAPKSEGTSEASAVDLQSPTYILETAAKLPIRRGKAVDTSRGAKAVGTRSADGDR